MPRLVLHDSISTVSVRDAGAVVVTGSHGGAAAVDFVAGLAITGLVFNDAGGGKHDAGIAALAVLDRRGIPAVAVSHLTARIGEAMETLHHGRVSGINGMAARAGIAPGMTTMDALARLGVTEQGGMTQQ